MFLKIKANTKYRYATEIIFVSFNFQKTLNDKPPAKCGAEAN